jgi:hypothetical protein
MPISPVRGWRRAWHAVGPWGAAVSLALRSTAVHAQGVAARGLNQPARASTIALPHRITLRICPRAGDTLRMRYDQQVDITGVRPSGASDPNPGRDSTVTRVTTLLVLSRTIVEGTDPGGTDLLAVTDSVAVGTTGGNGAAGGASESAELARRTLQGKQVHMRVSPDGAIAITDSAGVPPELRLVFADMPATLPREAIKVGHTWDRTMAVPVRGTSLGARTPGTAVLKSTFRFDSVSRTGDTAYLSMHGTLRRDDSHDPRTGLRMSMTGTVTGTMVVNRRRGWLTDSHAVIVVNSILTPPAPSAAMPPGVGPPALPPTHIQMTVTQWLRTVN